MDKIAEIEIKVTALLCAHANFMVGHDRGMGEMPNTEKYAKKILALFEGYRSPEEVEQMWNHIKDGDKAIRGFKSALDKSLDPPAQPKKVCPDCGGSRYLPMKVCPHKYCNDCPAIKTCIPKIPCTTCTDGYVYGWIPCEDNNCFISRHSDIEYKCACNGTDRIPDTNKRAIEEGTTWGKKESQ